MKSRPIYLVGVLALAIGVITLLFTTWQTSATTSSPNLNGSWIDDFDDSSLNDRWTWVRQDPTHWSLTDHPGFMRIITQPEGIWSTLNEQHNLLLTSAPLGDFSITTRVTFTPTQNYHQAGLLVYQDDDNYIKLHRAYDDGNWVGFVLEAAGTPFAEGVQVSETDVYLRISKGGSTYIGEYSVDGIDWIQVAQYTGTLTDLQVGLGVNHDNVSNLEIPADFDFFSLDDYTHYLFLPAINR